MSDAEQTIHEANWLRLRDAIHEQWPVLSEEELDATNGDRMAIEGLLEPMLSAPASNLAYAIAGSDPGPPAPCGGLRRSL